MGKPGGRSLKAVEVTRGISKQGRSATYRRRGLWAIKKKHGGKFPTHPAAAKPSPAAAKPRFYPAEDAPKPLHKKKARKATAPLRPSLVPGAVVILLVGRFKGKRAVFLKQLPSGLLLVSGPYAVNGVPARRVNAAYVVATSTRVDVSGVDCSAFGDDFFAKPSKDRAAKRSEEEFFATPSAEKKALPQAYVAAQGALDAALGAKLSDELKGYLSSRFTLRRGDKPHEMSF